MAPQLDVVIMLYKPGDIEYRLVREVSRLTPTPHRLHVFDNSKNEKNFSSGWNDLAAAGTAPYIAFLHSDVYPSHGWERPLIEALEQYQNFGAVLPNPGWFEKIGKSFLFSDPPTDAEMEGWAAYSRNCVGDIHVWTAKGPDCACFFCVVMRRKDFESLNGFDERLRFTGNNHELQWRLRDRGLFTSMIHASSVWHKDGLSFRKAIEAMSFSDRDEGLHWDRWRNLILSGTVKKWHEISSLERSAVRKDKRFRIGGRCEMGAAPTPT